VINENILCRVG